MEAVLHPSPPRLTCHRNKAVRRERDDVLVPNDLEQRALIDLTILDGTEKTAWSNTSC